MFSVQQMNSILSLFSNKLIPSNFQLLLRKGGKKFDFCLETKILHERDSPLERALSLEISQHLFWARGDIVFTYFMDEFGDHCKNLSQPMSLHEIGIEKFRWFLGNCFLICCCGCEPVCRAKQP